MKKFFNDLANGPFIDSPFEATREKYDEAIDVIVSHWISLSKRPLAVYQIGQVGAPGISDLDFVVVFPKGMSIEWSQYQPSVFPDWVQQMMTHAPYCCVESDWTKLPAWYPTFNMRHLWGEALPRPGLSEELKAGSALGMLTDYLIVKVPRDFLWIAWERPLRVRILLAMLHSLKYTIKLAEDGGIDFPHNTKEVIANIDQLRKKWFELEATVRLEWLSSLCESVCAITGQLITNLDKRISSHAGSVEVAPPLDCNMNNLFQFSSKWGYSDILQLSFENYGKSQQICWINPASFLHVLSIYSDECSGMGRYFREQGPVFEHSWDGGAWNAGLRYHAKAMELYAKNIEVLGVPSQKYVALGYVPVPSLFMRIKKRISKL